MPVAVGCATPHTPSPPSRTCDAPATSPYGWPAGEVTAAGPLPDDEADGPAEAVGDELDSGGAAAVKR